MDEYTILEILSYNPALRLVCRTFMDIYLNLRYKNALGVHDTIGLYTFERIVERFGEIDISLNVSPRNEILDFVAFDGRNLEELRVYRSRVPKSIIPEVISFLNSLWVLKNGYTSESMIDVDNIFNDEYYVDKDNLNLDMRVYTGNPILPIPPKSRRIISTSIVYFINKEFSDRLIKKSEIV